MEEKGTKPELRERNSGIELLRILCLLLIFWMHGAGSSQNNEVGAWAGIAADTIGNIGVSCFILISGYFGIKCNVKKLIQLDLMILVYCWIGLIFQLVWGADMGGEEMLTYLFPIIGNRSWYFTCYFALVLLSPFLNEAIEKINEQRLKQLVLTMLFIFSGITTFFFFDFTGSGGKGIIHMVMMYLIGRYIGCYRKNKKYKIGKLISCFFMISGINFALNGVLYLVTETVQNRFSRDCTLFTVAQAVLAFLIFKEIYFENRFINRMAHHVPAVFIMEWTLRGIVINYIYDYTVWQESSWYALIVPGIAVLLVMMGMVIDWLRNALFGKLEDALAEFLYKLIRKILPSPPVL